jgi:hypothetical protein
LLSQCKRFFLQLLFPCGELLLLRCKFGRFIVALAGK